MSTYVLAMFFLFPAGTPSAWFLRSLERQEVSHASRSTAAASLDAACEYDRRGPGASLILTGAVPLAGRRRRQRVVIYGRYSTDQQNEQSLADQEAKCRRQIQHLGLGDVEITVIQNKAMSGELARRPGIDRVWDAIETGSCEVIIAEEVSRFFRHTTRAMQFIEAAVDAGIRVVTVNDPIDTVTEDWRLNGHFASLKAELDNRQTRQRIKRSIEGRWEKGYVVNQTIKPGYYRVPVSAGDHDEHVRRPESARQPGYRKQTGGGPFVERKDEKWAPVIHKVFEMCAAGEPTWVIAKYLNDSGLPKSSFANVEQWSEDNVRTLVHDPVYRGVEEYRHKRVQQSYSKGKNMRVPVPSGEVLSRTMAHLRHVPDWLWFQANEALAVARCRRTYKKGPDHPLARVPRDRRGPLSKHFVCGICGAPMYRDGRRYRCGDCKAQPRMARDNTTPCWNRCMPLPEVVHAQIGAAIVDALTVQEGCFAALADEVRRIVEHGDTESDRKLQDLRRQEAELDRACRRLAKVAETASDLEEVVTQLRTREDERRRVRLEIERLSHGSVRCLPLPTDEEVRRLLHDVNAELLAGLSPEVGPLLRRLTTTIEAHPYALFDRECLFLRAHFHVDLLGVLPGAWRDVLAGKALADGAVTRVPVVVDLFETPGRIRYAKPVADLVAGGLLIKEAAAQLGIPAWTAVHAARTGRIMKERGLTDAYVRVTSMPKRPARWKPHSRRPDVFDAA